MHGLLRYVAMFTALIFILYKVNPPFIALLDLDPAAVMRGQVWRLVTYICVPQTGSILPLPDWLNAAFFVFFLIWVGDGLERAWGAHRLTVYFLLGMIGTTVAAFFFGARFSNAMLMASLFFAFARFYPDSIIYVAYILPMKMKWIAWITAGFILLQFVGGSMALRAATLVAFGNFFLFFGRDFFSSVRQRQTVSARRKRFEAEQAPADEPLHRCAVCGSTEKTDANLEFRVARDGEEYCLSHLPSAAEAAR